MEQAAVLMGVVDAKITLFKLCAGRDFTVVDGLQFTTSKNLQDKHKCSSENIANLACLAISHCSFSKLWLTRACSQRQQITGLHWLFYPLRMKVPYTGSSRKTCFWNTSPQRKPDVLQTSAPWQLKCFVSR